MKYAFDLRAVFLFLFLLTISGCLPREEKAMGKPNIVYILADDLGWADLPVYGNRYNEAPNLETLAAEGMVFTNAYAACPVCSPTRASIQSGQYPARVGVIDFIPGHWRPYEEVIVPTNRTQYLPLDIYTVGEAMKDAGYATGYFGKWHLGSSRTHGPAQQGYDEAVVYNGGGFYDFGQHMYPPQDIPADVVLSEALTDMAVDFIERNRENPFFLFLAHYDVHVQLDADSALISKYLQKNPAEGYPSNAVYAAMIEHIDNSTGRIMDRLSALGIDDNTMIVFFSDNGGLISRFDKIPLHAESKQYIYEGDTMQYIATSNDPLRAEKGTLYEGGIREPLIVKWPGKVPPGMVSDALISSVDFLPTFADIVGVEVPDAQVHDGISLVDILKGNPQGEERALFWHYPVYHHSVPASAVRKGDMKLIHFLDDDHVELYNLEEDIRESVDLATTSSTEAEGMKKMLDDWRRSVDARMPVPNPDFDPDRRHEWGRHPDRQ
jgi:uncharacterized sulfatase